MLRLTWGPQQEAGSAALLRILFFFRSKRTGIANLIVLAIPACALVWLNSYVFSMDDFPQTVTLTALQVKQEVGFATSIVLLLYLTLAPTLWLLRDALIAGIVFACFLAEWGITRSFRPKKSGTLI